MLTVQELEEVKTYVLRELPRVLEQDPEFVRLVDNIVSEKVPRRDEFARLLDELKATRRESHARFDKIDERFNETDEWRAKTDERFDKIDERFNETDEWRAKTDVRLDDFDDWRAKADAEFLHLRREGVRTKAHFDRIDRRMVAQDAWMHLYSGRQGSDKGQQLEDTFALALRYGLRNPDLSPKDIHLRVKLIDREGWVYPPGAHTEVDIIIHGQRWTVFEIKAAAEIDDVDSFANKLKLLRRQQLDKEIRGVFFSCIEDEWLQQRCQLYQIELVEPFSTLPTGPPPEAEIDAVWAREQVTGIPDEELE